MSKMLGEKFRPFEAFMLTRCTPEPFKLYAKLLHQKHAYILKHSVKLSIEASIGRFSKESSGQKG